jgi:hypothetical protein
MVVPFGVIGIEQRGRGLALNHHGEFPAEIGGIANAAVEPLPLPHRHQVRRIPGRISRPLRNEEAMRALWV